MGITTRILIALGLIATLTRLTLAQSRCNFTHTVRHNERAVLKNPFYINNIESCWFVYKVDRPGYGLRIDFTSFELEGKSCLDQSTNRTTCCDYLKIGAGFDFNSPPMGTYCGLSRPDSLLVGAEAAWFNFHTNQDHTFDGFKLELTPYRLTFDEPSNLISSPELVKNTRYANNMDVTYKIEARQGEVVSFRFQKLFIENYNSTCLDFLEIGSLDVSNKYQPRRFCGEDQIEKQFVVPSNRVYLRFVTDGSVTASGFELFYKTVKTVFTEPQGTLELIEYPLDVDYLIRAPADSKIELTVREFDFDECLANDVIKLVNAPYYVCTDDNDHIRMSNTIGSLRPEIFRLINDSEGTSKWVFCACNRPAKTYTSLSNELKIEYVHGKIQDTAATSKNHRVQKNSFKIDYKFIPMSVGEMQRLRIVQDRTETSLIGGYHVNIPVPAGHHLRLFGKSARCALPQHSFVAKWARNNQTSDHVYTRHMVVNPESFRKECSYLFDVSEPVRDVFGERVDWQVSWLLRFESPFELFDFEINWMLVKNVMMDETKSSAIDFPREIGFESLAHDLVLVFKSSSSARKYKLGFEVRDNELARNEKIRDYIKFRPKSSQGYEKIADKNELVPDQSEFALKIKRSPAFNLRISYQVGSQAGDCNFDQSICNYTSNLNSDDGLIASSLKNGQLIRHRPKYESISVNDPDMVKKSKDFYLVMMKTEENSEAVYSPLIQVQRESRSALFNKRAYTISFSYRISNKSLDQLEVILVKNRSETSVGRNVNLRPWLVREIVERYDHLSWQKDEKVKTVQSDGVCEARSSSEMAARFASLGKPTEEVEVDQTWFRVERLGLFSCYDFRVGFELRIDPEGSKFRAANVPVQLGIDEVQINQGDELQECEENVCGPNGICYMFENKPNCCCMAGFEGKRCERKLSACQFTTLLDGPTGNSICQNGGNCTDLPITFDYKCECPIGFTGKNCETEINECEPNPCTNNGRCIDRIGGFDCVCKTGFSGRRCENKNEECREKCAAYGTDECIKDKSKPPICVCKPGFTGDNCAIKLKVNKCLSSPCVGLSQCVNMEDSVKCMCPEDRTGKFCETLLNYCQDHVDLCKNGSACVYANKDASSFNCSCAAGFTGRYCNETINDCAQNPCENGKCIDVEIGFKCECEKGYVGRFCNIKPKDPCYRNKCQKGSCVPKIGVWGYNCHCHNDAEGEFCERKKCDKQLLIGTQCNANGTSDVVVINDKCHCLCKTDYTGANCENRINLCELREKTGSTEKECKNGGRCIYNNSTGAISCDCPKGFSGDRCEIVVNFCHGDPCKNGLCRNSHDSYVCECSPGWTGPNCTEQIEVCNMTEDCVTENTIAVHHSKHSCVCVCKLGFTGKKCETNINDCLAVKCENGGTCEDLVGSYRCRCPLGYRGPMCELKVENCDVNPCKNGNCIMLGTQIKCECDRGYTGAYCDTFIDKCKPNPCQNEAVCHNLIDSYHCECPSDFGSSQNCSDRLIDPCKNSPCFNNGQCSPIAKVSDMDKKTIVYTGFTCLCDDGYTGKLCEQPKNPCDSNPCHNRGQCRQSMVNEHEYTCFCYPAYTGQNCESHYDPCKESENQCLNGGSCIVTRREGQKCKCLPNYTGERCETNVNGCELMNCLNDGECIVSNGIPRCRCPNSRFVGTRCEIDLTLHWSNETIKLSSISSKSSPCGVLGNEVKTTDLIFFWLIIFGIFVIILAVVYTYVYLRIKKTKDYYKNLSSEKDALELNDSGERRSA